MNPTDIEWVRNPNGTKGRSWNPVTGCLGPEGKGPCSYCYARRMAARFGPHDTVIWSSQERGKGIYEARPGEVFPYGFAPTFYPHRLEKPLRIKQPSRIVVCSMGELFGESVPQEWIDQIFPTIARCAQHRFIIMTKCPQNIGDIEPCSNVWLLTSVEDQATWDKRVPEILKLRERGWPVLGVSVEPMLGPIVPYGIEELDWVIVGGQSPASAAQPEPEWVWKLVQKCEDGGVPLFMKNNLESSCIIRLTQQWPEDAPG